MLARSVNCGRESEGFLPTTVATAPRPAPRVASDDVARPAPERRAAPRRRRSIRRDILPPVCGPWPTCAHIVRACPERQRGAQLGNVLNRWTLARADASEWVGSTFRTEQRAREDELRSGLVSAPAARNASPTTPERRRHRTLTANGGRPDALWHLRSSRGERCVVCELEHGRTGPAVGSSGRPRHARSREKLFTPKLLSMPDPV